MTKHASRRVSVRTDLSEEEVKAIINSSKVILVAEEKNKKRKKIHKLFWSIKDNAHYIVVQDRDNGDIVTMLPPNSRRFVISEDTLSMARSLALDLPIYENKSKDQCLVLEVLLETILPKTHENNSSVSLRIKGSFQNMGSPVFEVNLGILVYNNYRYDLSGIALDIRQIINCELFKIKDPNQICIGFNLKINNRGGWHKFCLTNL